MVRPMLRRLFIPLTALAIGLALVAGCGGDDETTVTAQETVTETEPAPEPEPTTPAEPPADGKQGPGFFSTPSGNIACHISRDGARCDIRQRSWKPPPAPSSCELDYGQGLTVDADGAEFVCAGDTTLGAPATLPYGSSSVRGGFVCESDEAGVTCSDTSTGAGFFISRENYRIF